MYGTTPELRVRGFLQASAIDTGLITGVYVDASNTSSFEFVDLPASVTFTSASGVFLSAPVPELPTGTMLLVGLPLLLRQFSARRLRRAPDHC